MEDKELTGRGSIDLEQPGTEDTTILTEDKEDMEDMVDTVDMVDMEVVILSTTNSRTRTQATTHMLKESRIQRVSLLTQRTMVLTTMSAQSEEV